LAVKASIANQLRVETELHALKHVLNELPVKQRADLTGSMGSVNRYRGPSGIGLRGRQWQSDIEEANH
jgi:hypothetical protein